VISNPRQHARREPLYDIDPRTGASIECSTPIARWKRSAGAALVGFGALAGAALRRQDRRLVHLLRATQHIGTPWGPIWGLSATSSQMQQLNQRFEMIAWRRGRDSLPSTSDTLKTPRNMAF
jgi:hypothetical protein